MPVGGHSAVAAATTSDCRVTTVHSVDRRRSAHTLPMMMAKIRYQKYIYTKFFRAAEYRSIRSCQATWDVRCTLGRACYLVRSSHKPKESQSSPKLLWQHTFHLDGRTARAVGFMWGPGRHQMHCCWRGGIEAWACIPESRGSSRLETGELLLLRRRNR
jgi:hypothetical protein